MKPFLCFSILLAALSIPTVWGAEPLEPKTAERLARLLDTTMTDPATHPIIGAEQMSRRAVLLKPNTDWEKPESLIWEWDPAKSPDILPEHVRWFDNISEVKPMNGTDELLVVASGGGVALIRVSDQKVLFYANAGGNTHSAAVLPDRNIVTASSSGNFLRIFTVPDTPIPATDARYAQFPFIDTHGVVWDHQREILWVLGGKEIAGFRYTGTKSEPSLEEIFREELPPEITGGHDLYPVPGSDLLFVTGKKGFGVFDPKERKLSPVRDFANIKSISLDEEGNFLVLIPVEEWWSPTPRYLNRAEENAGTLPEARFYKVRWWIPSDF